ncbi:MAG: hypothetical protein COA43_16335 [Robiginitomaculum sp.]|nr:MAG: hypothetical protein COA43_16335 [Robiginitomaculum sp.]
MGVGTEGATDKFGFNIAGAIYLLLKNETRILGITLQVSLLVNQFSYQFDQIIIATVKSKHMWTLNFYKTLQKCNLETVNSRLRIESRFNHSILKLC